jgi:hypothetical protein
MELPKEKIKATNKNPRTLILFGPPKIGKTTIISQLDNNLILDLEKGTGFVDALKIEVNSISEIKQVGTAIIEAGRPYKYLTIDTASALEVWAEDLATAMYRKDPKGINFKGKSVLELPMGAGYLWLRIAFKQVIDYIETLAEHIILVCHVKDKVTDVDGKELSIKDLDLTGKIKNITSAGADAIGYVYRKDDKLMINFQSSEELCAGSRCDHLRGQNMEFDWSKIYIN